MLPRAQGLFEPSVVASRGFELERCPVEVRRYMLRKVLQNELTGMGFEVNQSQIEALIIA